MCTLFHLLFLRACRMIVNGRHYRSIWLHDDGWRVEIIDQTRLPHTFTTQTLSTVEEAFHAIQAMQVRGAPLIGATAAYGICLAMRQDPSDASLQQALQQLLSSRPTAVNLHWSLQRMQTHLEPLPPDDRLAASYALAAKICDEDAATNEAIGQHGLKLIETIANEIPERRPLNILTHCNAGWLATVDWGTALAPIYKAREAGIDVHVWVDETRPRNQGAALTAWELGQQDIPHHVICDNAGGHLMQNGTVDLCIVGTDRVTARGDVCNKIGTYLKALAAADNDIPFYVALPGSTIDWRIENGFEIPIEYRPGKEVTHLTGLDDAGQRTRIRLTPEGSTAINPAFDITPAKLVTALITERGVCQASPAGLRALYPESASA